MGTDDKRKWARSGMQGWGCTGMLKATWSTGQSQQGNIWAAPPEKEATRVTLHGHFNVPGGTLGLATVTDLFFSWSHRKFAFQCWGELCYFLQSTLTQGLSSRVPPTSIFGWNNPENVKTHQVVFSYKVVDSAYLFLLKRCRRSFDSLKCTHQRPASWKHSASVVKARF